MTDDIHSKPKRSTRTALIAAGLLGIGVAGGIAVGAVSSIGGPRVEMAPTKPTPIKALADSDSIVTVRGRVAEAYGPMFVLADGTGRTLVDGGRRIDGTGMVAVGQTVQVQGRFRDAILHASFLVGADGKVTALHPDRGPHGPRGGPGRGPGGPRPELDGFADEAAPPVAPAPVPAPVPAPAVGNAAG